MGHQEQTESKITVVTSYPKAMLSHDWLVKNGWNKLERLERQPTDHYRRCIAMETYQDDHFMIANEDLCIDVAPNVLEAPAFWFCWITRASSQNRQPSTWLHVRQIRTVGDLMLLYEGLTGRFFSEPSSRVKNLGQPFLGVGYP